VKFDNCKLHHVVWWEHGGTTDLHNMLPLCERHHCVHDRGWILTLGSRRELRVQTPDGHVMTTGPPSREAA
jgi:predicted restriction endonuclease